MTPSAVRSRLSLMLTSVTLENKETTSRHVVSFFFHLDSVTFLFFVLSFLGLKFLNLIFYFPCHCLDLSMKRAEMFFSFKERIAFFFVLVRKINTIVFMLKHLNSSLRFIASYEMPFVALSFN